MNETTHIIKKEKLGISVSEQRIITIEQRRASGVEAWVSISLDELKEVVRLAEEDLN
jgi:hypothetical protein